MSVLLCDAGGTHIRFARARAGELMGDPQKYKIDLYPDFTAVAAHFLAGQAEPPESITEVRLAYGGLFTWPITPETIAPLLPAARLIKINDFEANAYGIAYAAPDALLPLYTPSSPRPDGSARLVIGVGTGLGLAQIIDTPTGPHIQKNHGGHMLPALPMPHQRDLFDALQPLKARPSVMIYEDLLSGPGLYKAYGLMASRAQTDREYHDTNDMIARGRHDPLVQETVRVFHEVLGLFAHQAVAFTNAYGGLYLTGGVIDRLVGAALFDMDTFLRSFDQSSVPLVKNDVAATPLYWVKDEFIALSGLLRVQA